MQSTYPTHLARQMDESILVLPKLSQRSFVWQSLRRYQNTAYVGAKIGERFGVSSGTKQWSNVQKQANQIRWSLQQASEYYNAAETVSTATRPLLLYYCCSSLALTEILWRGDGSCSLDQLRGSHGNHGLERSFDLRKEGTLEEAAMKLRARPISLSGNRVGIFEVWHSLSRHKGIIGVEKTKGTSPGTLSDAKVILAAVDETLPEFPVNGLSLLDCITRIAGMITPLGRLGVNSNLVRATINQAIEYENNAIKHFKIHLIAQPGNKAKSREIESQIFLAPSAVFRGMEYQDYPGGFIISIDPRETGLRLPEGVSLSQDQTFLYDRFDCLNEFGFYYCALFILGMLSRYFSDIWMWHIERNTDLVLAAEALLDLCVERLPMLLLGALDQSIPVYPD